MEMESPGETSPLPCRGLRQEESEIDLVGLEIGRIVRSRAAGEEGAKEVRGGGLACVQLVSVLRTAKRYWRSPREVRRLLRSFSEIIPSLSASMSCKGASVRSRLELLSRARTRTEKASLKIWIWPASKTL